MKIHNHQPAFSIMTSIIVIILMSTVSMLVLSLSSKVVKETTAQYQREQAVLLANSYTEYAVMAVTANDRNTTECLRQIRGTMNGYNAKIELAYIGLSSTVQNCRKLDNSVKTEDTPLTIIVDAYISYDDLDNNVKKAPQITYHKRTVQKI